MNIAIHCKNGAVIVDPTTGEVLSRVYRPVDLRVEAATQDSVLESGRAAIPVCMEDGGQVEILRRYGKFVWNIFDSMQLVFTDLPTSLWTRIALLATYMNEEGEIADSFGLPFRQDEIQQVLMMPDGAFRKFMDRIERASIVDLVPGAVRVKEEVIRVSPLDTVEESMLGADRETISKTYIRAVRHLYANASAQSMEYLCYVFRLLPFVNWKYHIICENPLEEDARLLRPLTLGDFADNIRYRRNEVDDLLRFLMTPACMVGDEACRIVNYMPGTGDGVENYYLCVDPRVCCP